MSQDEPIEASELDSDSPSDRQLLDDFQHGQTEAASEIYERYWNRLFALARRRTGFDLAQRLDPEDVVQSVFRTFFRRAADGSYELPDGDTLWKLLMVITLNKIRTLADYHRAAKRDVRKTKELEFLTQSLSKSSIEAEDLLGWTIRELTESLPPEHQRIIEMRIKGFKIEEIAATCQRSKRTTERVLQSFRDRLFAELKAGGVG